MSIGDDLALNVGDLIVQVHDIQSDINLQAEDLRYHQEFEHDDFGLDAFDEVAYELGRDIDDINDRLDTILNTRTMRPSRVRHHMPATGRYFGRWFRPDDPWGEVRRRARKALKVRA